MELTAFHAVAGLVAGECSGLITSLIAMSLEKTASRTLLPHPFRSVENDGQTVCFHGGSTYHQPGDDSSFQQPGESSDPAKTAGIWLQCFGCPEYFWYPDRYDHVHHSVSQCTDQFLFRPFTSSCLGSPQCTQPRTDCANDKKSNPVRDCFLALFLRFCFWFSVTGWAKFCFTIRWPAIYLPALLAVSPAVCHQSAEQYPARTRQCPAGFICHTAGMHDQDLHDPVSRPTVRNRCISVGDAAVLCILLRLQTFFCLCLIPAAMIPHFLISLRQKKTPVSTDHSAGTGVSLSGLFYYKV